MKPKNPTSDVSRRDLLAASAASALLMSPGVAASAANAGAAAKRGQVRSEILTFDDPVEEFREHLRIERSLVDDEGSTLTWFEYSYYRRVAPMEYRIHAHNLSYARDLKTGEFLRQIENPLTGRMLKVEPAVLLTDPGVLASPRGFRNLKSDGKTWRQPFRVFRIQDDLVKFDSVRTAPPDMPTVHIENSCQWVSRRLFDDASIRSLPVEFAGVYLFPFPKWLEMGDRKGHMYGMWDGRKLGGPADLPVDFLRRTEREFPELLAPRWKEFERPIPFPL